MENEKKFIKTTITLLVIFFCTSIVSAILGLLPIFSDPSGFPSAFIGSLTSFMTLCYSSLKFSGLENIVFAIMLILVALFFILLIVLPLIFKKARNIWFIIPFILCEVLSIYALFLSNAFASFTDFIANISTNLINSIAGLVGLVSYLLGIVFAIFVLISRFSSNSNDGSLSKDYDSVLKEIRAENASKGPANSVVEKTIDNVETKTVIQNETENVDEETNCVSEESNKTEVSEETSQVREPKLEQEKVEILAEPQLNSDNEVKEEVQNDEAKTNTEIEKPEDLKEDTIENTNVETKNIDVLNKEDQTVSVNLINDTNNDSVSLVNDEVSTSDKGEENKVEEKPDITTKKTIEKVTAPKKKTTKTPATKKPVAKKPAEPKAFVVVDAFDPVTGTMVQKQMPKVYHVAKRVSDNKWTIKFTSSDKVLKLCDTKEEALAYANFLAQSQGATVAFHASKGRNKGKIQKK